MRIIQWCKRVFYFPLAWYFRFFAQIRLSRWHPRIVMVTGSNGKTTLIHLLEAQIGERARYSHHANSSYGIPFDILGMQRKTLLRSEWIRLFWQAPWQAFKAPPREKLYIVEADCDRPGEGTFLGSLLRPEIVLWVSVSHTHTMNFDSMIQEDRGVNSFQTVDEAVAYEFGYFLEYCQKLAIINGDLPLEAEQASRAKSKVIAVRKSDVLKKYEITKEHTVFTLPQGEVRFAALLPEEVAYALAMCWETVRYLDLPFDTSFSKFQLPPGRSSLFTGVKHITIVDSCYNANLASMAAILAMFAKYPASHKWVVIGDMLEQGRDEAEEHEKLADLLMEMKLERVILMGPRVKAYTYEKLVQSSEFKAKRFVLEAFLYPKEVLDYLEAQLAGGEAVLFKGARFLEGVIEHLLADKRDVSKLSRREKIWEIRRKQWGL